MLLNLSHWAFKTKFYFFKKQKKQIQIVVLSNKFYLDFGWLLRFGSSAIVIFFFVYFSPTLCE